MAIKVGDTIPAAKVRHMTKDGPKEITTDELFKGKKVAVFGLPGAFTRTCSPVAGFRAMRAGRLIFANFAKPVMLTISPFATLARMTSIVPSTTLPAVLLSTPV